jgi:tetratricopeptide (TPR) repeat protein
MGAAWKEQVIQELIAEGNDEQVVRMIDALWDLEPEQINERLDLQMRLGRRYLVLALSQTGGTSDEDLEVLLEREFEQGIPAQSGTEGNRIVLEWYAEAEKLFVAVLERASLLRTKAEAFAHRGFLHFLRGASDLALADLDQACSFLPLSPDLSYWRGMILASLGALEAAQVALKFASEHDQDNERYRRAYVRVMGNGGGYKRAVLM